MMKRREQLFEFFADFFKKNREMENAKYKFTEDEEQLLLKKYFNRYFDGASNIYSLQSSREVSEEEESSDNGITHNEDSKRKPPKFYGNAGWQPIKDGIK